MNSQQLSEPLIARHGVITLFGYGISANVERGHLILKDGVGPKRRYCRLARINHGLKRLVVIGSDGMISFSALRWLLDQDAAFCLLEREGTVLANTGPVAPSGAPNICGICGMSIATACKYCRTCATTVRRENVIKASQLGRLHTQMPQAQARRSFLGWMRC